MLRKNMISD